MVGLKFNEYRVIYVNDEDKMYVSKGNMIVYEPTLKDGLNGCLQYINDHLVGPLYDFYYNSLYFQMYKDVKWFIEDSECHNLSSLLFEYEYGLRRRFGVKGER